MLKLLKASVLTASILLLSACGESGVLTMKTTPTGCYFERTGMLLLGDNAQYTNYPCFRLLTDTNLNVKHYKSITIDGVEYVK